jgi:hypothetical protein
MIDDKNLFQKFKYKSKHTKEEQRLHIKVLDPFQHAQVDTVEQRNHLIAPYYADYMINKRRIFKDTNQ